MRYTIKSLTRMAQKEYMCDDAEFMLIIKGWMQDGIDMINVFNNMPKKEVLCVIDLVVTENLEWYSNHSLLMDIYKCAMTSLEKRL